MRTGLPGGGVMRGGDVQDPVTEVSDSQVASFGVGR